MASKRIILLVLSFAFIFSQIRAQIVEIPIEVAEGGHVFLKVKVNDHSEPLNFVLDSGATVGVLDSVTAVEIGLKPNAKQHTIGASGIVEYEEARNQTVIIQEDIKITDCNLLLPSLAALNEYFDIRIDGLIGYKFFKKYITQIDYENKKLILYDRLTVDDTKDFSSIPFNFGDGLVIPQFDISITLKNGETFTGPIIFDSGAGLGLEINSPFNEENEISVKAVKKLTSKSSGLNHESKSESIAIQSLKFGNYTFENLVTSISYSKAGVTSWDGFLGLLGAKIIRRFNIILDYNTMTLYLKPNKYFNDEFEFPLSGIALKDKEGGVYLNYLDETTPAYKLGLREGDQLISINDISFENKKDYAKILKTEGLEAELKVIDASGVEKVITILLEKLL